MLRELGVTSMDTDLLTFVVGLPWGNPGSTNMIRVTSAAGTGRPYTNLACSQDSKNSKITSPVYSISKSLSSPTLCSCHYIYIQSFFAYAF